MSTHLKFRGKEASKYKSVQFAQLFLFFSGKNNKEQKVYTSIRCELYLVEGLRANILMGNNILAPESFVLNVGLGHSLMESCRVKITFRAIQRSQFLRKKLLTEKNKFVPPRSKAMIPLLPELLSDDRDFLFHITA